MTYWQSLFFRNHNKIKLSTQLRVKTTMTIFASASLHCAKSLWHWNLEWYCYRNFILLIPHLSIFLNKIFSLWFFTILGLDNNCMAIHLYNNSSIFLHNSYNERLTFIMIQDPSLANILNTQILRLMLYIPQSQVFSNSLQLLFDVNIQCWNIHCETLVSSLECWNCHFKIFL